MKELVLVGGGGHCASCIDVIEQDGQFVIVGILDVPGRVGESVHGYAIVGTDADIPKHAAAGRAFLITVGQIKSAAARVRLFDSIVRTGGMLPIVVSPHAYVSKHASLGPGTMVMHQAVVNAGAIVGANVIVNSCALVEHDAQIGDHCHIATRAVINGAAVVARESFIGSGAILHQGAIVSEKTIVAAGQVFRTRG